VVVVQLPVLVVVVVVEISLLLCHSQVGSRHADELRCRSLHPASAARRSLISRRLCRRRPPTKQLRTRRVERGRDQMSVASIRLRSRIFDA